MASNATFALKALLYFFRELATAFLLVDACLLPAILSHEPVQFSAPIILDLLSLFFSDEEKEEDPGTNGSASLDPGNAALSHQWACRYGI
jgi:hypothetical protein